LGKHNVLHAGQVLRLPMIIEIVDSRDKIENFQPPLDEIISDGLVTVERVKVLHYNAANV
jgi:PII-like signaling protein